MLKQSNMKSIYNALKVSAPTSVFSKALAASPWDGSHYASEIKAHGSDFLNFFPELAAFATSTGTNPTSTLGGAVGVGSQPSTSISATQAGADAMGTAKQIGELLAGGAPVEGQTPQSGLAGIGQELGSLGSDLGKLTSAATDLAFWKRVGIFVGGAALGVVGLVILLSQTSAGKEAGSVASVAAVA
jgi:hypothetical protein